MTRRDGPSDSADKRPLSAEEMRVYWKLLEAAPGLRGSCLRMHLLTGGQRIEQLVRLRRAEVRDESITIYDNKGRPRRGARVHTVPIIKTAMRDLQAFERVGDHAQAERDRIARDTLTPPATRARLTLHSCDQASRWPPPQNSHRLCEK
jgi:integrase